MLRREVLKVLPCLAAGGCAMAPKPAPDFELLELSGRYLRLSDWKGKPVLLTFWSASCGICRVELPDLERLRLEYGSSGVALITVSGDARGTATSFLNENHINLLTVVDPQLSAFQAFGVSGVPTTILVDERGNLKKRWIGRSSRAIRQWLERNAG